MKIQIQFNENSQLQFSENPSVSNIIFSSDSVVATSDHSSRELQMATDETHEIQLNEFSIENDLAAFLFLMLDKLEECLSRLATITSHIQAQFVVVDKTVHLLRSIAESNEKDRLEWEAIAQAFSAILFAVQEHLKTHLRFVYVSVRLLELELQADHHFILLLKTWKIFVELAFDGKTLPSFLDSAMDRLSPSPVLWLAKHAALQCVVRCRNR